MQREALGLAVRDSKASEALVRQVCANLANGEAPPAAVHVLHVAFTSLGDSARETRQAVRFIGKRFCPHLRSLPPTCAWSFHIIVARRPSLVLANDEVNMTAHALVRKAAQLRCTRLLIQGRGLDRLSYALLMGHSLPHCVLMWSRVPVVLFDAKHGFCEHPVRGAVPLGQDPEAWRASVAPAPPLRPLREGLLVWQPDGAPVGACACYA